MTEPLEEFLIFSDLHAHNFKYGSKRVQHNGGTYNSRLIDTIGVLEEIHDYAEANQIRSILFGGDLFHRRSILHTDAYNLVFDTLAFMAEGREIVMIPGNHDYADRHGLIHSLEPFDHIPGVHVYDGVDVHWLGMDSLTGVVTVPYTDDLVEAQRRLKLAGELADSHSEPCILLAHLGMQGARVGSDYILVSDQDVRVSDVPHESFVASFFGHYHEHQPLFGNGWYIGSTHQQNWGDSGGKRGFLHVRVFENRVEFKRIETGAPLFITLDHDNMVCRDKDFVRICVDTVSASVARRLRQQMGRDDIEIVSRVDKDNIVLTLQASQLDPESAMAAWLEANPPEDLKTSEVLEEGRTFLRNALGRDL